MRRQFSFPINKRFKWSFYGAIVNVVYKYKLWICFLISFPDKATTNKDTYIWRSVFICWRIQFWYCFLKKVLCDSSATNAWKFWRGGLQTFLYPTSRSTFTFGREGKLFSFVELLSWLIKLLRKHLSVWHGMSKKTVPFAGKRNIVGCR